MPDQSAMCPTHFETTLGSYSPFLLRIVIKRLHDGLGKGERSPQEFRNSEIATFFHEFIHHIQNISTIAGMSHLNSMVSLWHNARNVVNNPRDLLSLELVRAASENINNYKINNPKNAQVNFPEIVSIEGDGQDIIDLAPLAIKCQVEGVETYLKFGIAEFFESSAYALESFFRKQIGLQDVSHETPSTPY
jgi:hypothetical protein